MPNQISTSGISGIDGKVPVYDSNGLFHIWSINEIYTGGVGQNRFVPKVDDQVVRPETDEKWRVVSIDPTTLVPTLVSLTSVSSGILSDNDLLLGVGPGTASDTYRVYVDKSVVPHILAVDARLKVAGSMVNHAVIYRGSDLKGTAVAISALYDQTGTLLGQAIPLELVAMDGNNISIKTVPVCHTSADLPDGEVVTAVFYSDIGNVVSKRQLLVENTAFIRSSNAAVKYITGITLESPFLSKTDNMLIQYPINVPLEGLNLIGVVTYSDGSQIRLPVNNTKFSIFGFSGFIASVVGQKFNIVLKYALSPGEIVYGSQAIGGQFMTETYKATTVKADGAFTVKLFGFPVWINATEGYGLEWFMYTLDRNIMYRVTPHVKFDVNSRVFNPTAYGTNQHLAVNLNMSDVNATFASYKHIQTADIALLAAGDARTTNWTVGFLPNQNPLFGTNNFAVATTIIGQVNTPVIHTVNLTSGAVTKDEWLQKLYLNTLPLTDPNMEVSPPLPNYFALIINGQSVEFPIAMWNSDLAISVALANNSTLFVKFILRTPTNDTQLSVAGIPVYVQ